MDTHTRLTHLALIALLVLGGCSKSPAPQSGGAEEQGQTAKLLHQDISQAGAGTAQPATPAPAPAANQPASAASAPLPAPPPGFDCAKASTKVETLICSDRYVAAMDAHLSALYSELKDVPELKLKSEQAAWIKGTRNRCETIECLREAYTTRIDDLDAVQLYLNKPAEFR